MPGLGALSQLRIACPDVVTAFVWPDTMLNLSDATAACMPMFDAVATYSSSSVPLSTLPGKERTNSVNKERGHHGTKTRESR